MKALVDLLRCTFVSKRHLRKPCFKIVIKKIVPNKWCLFLTQKGILLNIALLSHFQMQQNL
jgi:hypothetical protein